MFRIGDDIEIGTVRGQVQYEVHRALLERFRKRDIELAYAVREIRMRSAKA